MNSVAIRHASMSVLLIVGPKCTLAASHADPWQVTLSMRCAARCIKVRKNGAERQTDGQTPDVETVISTILKMGWRYFRTSSWEENLRCLRCNRSSADLASTWLTTGRRPGVVTDSPPTALRRCSVDSHTYIIIIHGLKYRRVRLAIFRQIK